jgi:hypothetical protein
MLARVMVLRPSSIRREVLVSTIFTALLVVSILLLLSVLLTGNRAGPGQRWPFQSLSTTACDGIGEIEEEQARYPMTFVYLISASTGDASHVVALGTSLNLRVGLSCCKLSSTAIRSWLDGFVAFDFNRDKFLYTFFWVHKV